MFLAAFFAGDGADGVLSGEATALFADAEIPLQQVVVVLHLRDLIQLFEDGFLGDLEDLDFAALEVEDGDGDGKLHIDGARAATAFAGLEVAHLGGDVLGGGLVVEAERLGCAVASAPGFVELQGLVGEHGEADGAAVGKFAKCQVAATCVVAGDCGGGLF